MSHTKPTESTNRSTDVADGTALNVVATGNVAQPLREIYWREYFLYPADRAATPGFL